MYSWLNFVNLRTYFLISADRALGKNRQIFSHNYPSALAQNLLCLRHSARQHSASSPLKQICAELDSSQIIGWQRANKVRVLRSSQLLLNYFFLHLDSTVNIMYYKCNTIERLSSQAALTHSTINCLRKIVCEFIYEFRRCTRKI
jgi:hypothetical protein